MKYLLIILIFLSSNLLALTDNYNINQKMIQKYEKELSNIFYVYKDIPKPQKYYSASYPRLFDNRIAKFEQRNQWDKNVFSDTDNHYFESYEIYKKQLTGGGYGDISNAFYPFSNGIRQKVYDSKESYYSFVKDVLDTIYISVLMKNSLERGQNKVLYTLDEIKEYVQNKAKTKALKDNGFNIYEFENDISNKEYRNYNYYVFLKEEDVIELGKIQSQFLNDLKNERNKISFNGDWDKIVSENFIINFEKGKFEISFRGREVYTNDSVFGYSLNRSNSFTKNKNK